MIVLDTSFIILDFNTSALKLFAYEKNELLGKNITEFTDANEFEINHEALNQLKNGDIPNYKSVHQFLNKSGNYLSFEIIISLIKDPNSSTIYYSGLFNKLSLFKTKQIIDVKNEKIETILNQSPVIQYIFDIEKNKQIFENKSLLNKLGYKKSDLDGLSEIDFLDSKIPKEYLQEFKHKLNTFKKSKCPKEVFKIEYPILNKKNELVWLYDKAVALKVKKTGEKTYSYGTIIDITERKLKLQKISEQQHFIEKVSQSIPEFIFTTDIKNQTVFFSNQRSKKVLGYSEKEFKEITKEEIIHAHNYYDYLEKINDILKSTHKKSFVSKLQLLHKTKGYRWYKVSTIVFSRDENNLPLTFLRIVEDIHQNEVNILENKIQDNFIKNVVDKLPITAYVIDLKSQKLLFSNLKSVNIFGYTNEYWIKNVNQLFHKDYIKKQISSVKSFIELNNNKTLESEVLIKHKTLGYRWYKTKLKIIKRDKYNKPKHILEIFDDIHELKMKNIKISEQEKLIETITNSIDPYLYFYSYSKKKYIYTNFENRKIFGYDKDYYLHKGKEFVHPDYLNSTDKFVQELKHNKEKNKFETELPIKNKAGIYKWIKLKIIVIKRNDDGSPDEILEISEDIDELKKKALLIAEQQNLIEKISSTIPDYIYLKDSKTNKIILTNNKCEDVLGYLDKDFTAQNENEYVLKEHLNKLKRHNEETLQIKNVKHFSIDVLFKHKSLGYRWFRKKSIVFERDQDLKPSKILVLISNIHESKLNIKKIIEQQKFIKKVASTIPQYLSVYDIKEQKTIYTNFEDKLIFGYTKDEFLKNCMEAVHPDFKEQKLQLRQEMINSINKDYSKSIELKLKHKTKGYIWAKVKIVITKRNENNEALQALEIIEDIDQSKKSFNQIIEQEHFIQKIARTAPVIIQVSDVINNKVIYTNFGNKVFLNYNKKQWNSTGLDIIHPNFIKDYKKDLRSILNSNINKVIENEFLIKNKEGVYKWVLAITSIFKVEKNKVVQIMTVFENINNRKLLQLNLEKQLSKNIELERFAAITSHDLKEPLRTLSNYAQILQQEHQNNLDNDGKELLNHIASSSKRMGSLINDILDFSKVQTEGKKFEQVDLNDIINLVLLDLKENITETNTAIEACKLPIIVGDKTQVRQLFQNLISNAIKFSTEKNPLIKIKSSEQNEFHKITVEDNGIGIKQSELKNIFGIFKKLHKENEFEGQGIGLSICKRIVERHEGEIWVESVLKEGTSFHFTFPKVKF